MKKQSKSRPLVYLILFLALIVGGLFYLSSIDTEQPLTRVEKPVPNDKLAK